MPSKPSYGKVDGNLFIPSKDVWRGPDGDLITKVKTSGTVLCKEGRPMNVAKARRFGLVAPAKARKATADKSRKVAPGGALTTKGRKEAGE